MTHLPVSTNVQPGWRFDHYSYPLIEGYDSVGADPGVIHAHTEAFDTVPEGELWMLQALCLQSLRSDDEHVNAPQVDLWLDDQRDVEPLSLDYLRRVVGTFVSAGSPAVQVRSQPLHVPERNALSVTWRDVGGFATPVNNMLFLARAQFAIYKSSDRDRNA